MRLMHTYHDYLSRLPRFWVVGVFLMLSFLGFAMCGDDCDVVCAPCTPPAVNVCSGHTCGCKPGAGYPSPLISEDLSMCLGDAGPDASADACF